MDYNYRQDSSVSGAKAICSVKEFKNLPFPWKS